MCRSDAFLNIYFLNKPNQTKPTRPDPTQPDLTQPNQTKPNPTKQNQTKQNQTKQNKTKQTKQKITINQTFFSRTERFGSFLFCFFYSNLGLPRAKSLQNGHLSFLISRRKIKPVTTNKMASHLIDMNIIFQENMCLTNLMFS